MATERSKKGKGSTAAPLANENAAPEKVAKKAAIKKTAEPLQENEAIPAKKVAPKKAPARLKAANATSSEEATGESSPVKELKAASSPVDPSSAEVPVKKTAAKKAAKKSTAPKKALPPAAPAEVIEEMAATGSIAVEETPAEPQKEESDSRSLKVTFKVRYSTQYGQRLFITGNHQLLGNCDASKAYPMKYLNAEYWTAEIDFTGANAISEDIIYNYLVIFEDGAISQEWGKDKVISPSKIATGKITLVDSWNYAGYYENTFYTEPFQQVLLKQNFTPVEANSPVSYTHTFRVKAPLLPKNHVLFIAGNAAELGNWLVNENQLLSRSEDEDFWNINIDLSIASFPLAYKYGVYNVEEKQLVQYETGDNRIFREVTAPDELTIVSDGFVRLPNNSFKGAGVAIPVFSLRSNNGLGVGEFNDIRLLVDWARSIGLKLVQILPINDTTATYTWVDSYPYAAISAFALHPIYIHLPSVVSRENEALLEPLLEKQQQLNALAAIDYEQVMNLKMSFLRQVFPSQKEATFSSADFQSFFASNAHWLVPYAAFSFLRDKYKTADFTQWPSNSSYNAEEINSVAGDPLAADENLSIYYFIQYHLHCQLKAATEYAHQNGIIVKGDIPIGIFRNSCDAWQEPELYYMDQQAGAPPDDFAVRGQNWGFPTYNWHRMAEDGFTWWKRRFKQMSYYFDAFRIDHILGFFRIWSIPMHAVEGIMGTFVPALPVHINEFHERGITVDHERFTKPFINDSVLAEVFGGDTEPVKQQYLESLEDGRYKLRDEFCTQRKVEAYFNDLEKNEENNRVKQGLYDLISNVILFSVEGSQGLLFHFRISIDQTSSFRHFDEATRRGIYDLYINYFYRRQDAFWRKEAMLKLPELKRSTNMLICGEDLGMVPATVPGVMKDLAILSLEIQRMPKDPSIEFFHPNNAPYLSVVTPSTHDMSTIRGWWEEDRVKIERFYRNELGRTGDVPYFCEPWINRVIVLMHLYSPAMWSIFQLQDLLGISGEIRRQNPHEERINIPANPKHYWQYRVHLTLEELLQQDDFNEELRGYIMASGRA